MRRIIFSIILGIVFPFICLIIFSWASNYLPDGLVILRFYGVKAPGILAAPFAIPVYLEIFVKAHRLLPKVLNNFWFSIIFFILFDWILYGTIFYFVLGRFKRFKKKTVETSPEPPEPPQF